MDGVGVWGSSSLWAWPPEIQVISNSLAWLYLGFLEKSGQKSREKLFNAVFPGSCKRT